MMFLYTVFDLIKRTVRLTNFFGQQKNKNYVIFFLNFDLISDPQRQGTCGHQVCI